MAQRKKKLNRHGFGPRSTIAKLTEAVEKLQRSYEQLTQHFRDLKSDAWVERQTCRAELRNEATRAREHAELVTRLLMYFRSKGKMPRNWRSLTIGELLGFATTLPSVESIGELSEIPVLSRAEAYFILDLEEKATDRGLAYSEVGYSLVRKAKVRLQVQE